MHRCLSLLFAHPQLTTEREEAGEILMDTLSSSSQKIQKWVCQIGLQIDNILLLPGSIQQRNSPKVRQFGMFTQ